MWSFTLYLQNVFTVFVPFRRFIIMLLLLSASLGVYVLSSYGLRMTLIYSAYRMYPEDLGIHYIQP